MKVGRYSDCWRQYGIVVNGKDYEVNNIRFYDESGVIVSSGNGWLQTGKYGGDIKEIDIPTEEIKLRRKENFDGQVFVIIHREQFANESVAELYIPAEMFDIHFVENTYVSSIRQVYKVYKGSNGIYIEQYVKSVDGNLREIRRMYDEVHKSLSSFNFSVNDNMLESIDKLKALAEAFIAERDRLDNLTIDDIEL